MGACTCEKLFRRIGGAFLWRVARLAKSQGSRRSDLSSNGAVSEERDIWSDMLGQTGRRFGCFKHRGGPSQINSRRIPALPRPSAALYWNSTLNWLSR